MDNDPDRNTTQARRLCYQGIVIVPLVFVIAPIVFGGSAPRRRIDFWTALRYILLSGITET